MPSIEDKDALLILSEKKFFFSSVKQVRFVKRTTTFQWLPFLSSQTRLISSLFQNITTMFSFQMSMKVQEAVKSELQSNSAE